MNSSEIISQCEQNHGQGRVFFRTDGLQFEERRARLRREYLDGHPATRADRRAAILSASATPGMTREELSAAWGLLEEDTRMVFGHVTETPIGAFAYFTGFEIGESYAVYLRDDVVLGIKATEELVAPHKYELTMRITEEKRGLHHFYPGRDDFLVGSDIDQNRADWDTLHNFLYVIEPVMPLSSKQIEGHLYATCLMESYKLALSDLGFSRSTVTTELCAFVALNLIPYPQQPDLNIWETPPPPRPIKLPAHLLLEDPAKGPPKEWFAEIAAGLPCEAVFFATGDATELVKVERVKDRIFRVTQVPLFVNDVAPYDLVELGWRVGELVPYFKRKVERGGHRVIRAVLKQEPEEDLIEKFIRDHVSDTQSYRRERGVLVFSILTAELKPNAEDWLGYIAEAWIYTDTRGPVDE